MGNPYKLYQAVKSGQVKLDDLNELGKSALKYYMEEKEKRRVKPITTSPIHADADKWIEEQKNKKPLKPTLSEGEKQYLKAQEVGRQSKNPVTRLSYKISDALYDWLAPKGEKEKAEFDDNVKLAYKAMYGDYKPISRGQAVMSGIITGMTGGLLGFSPEEYKQIDPSHSKAHTVGRMAGYVLPSAASYKGASIVAGGLGKVAPVLSKKLPQIAIKGALTEVPLGITEGISQGKDAKGIAKNTALYSGLGTLGDVAIEGILIPLIAPYAKKAGVALNKYIGDALQKTKASTTLSAIVDEDALAKEFARNLGVDWDSMNTTQRSAIRKLALNAQAPATQSGKLLKSAPGEGPGFIMVDPKAKAQEAFKLNPKEEIVAKSLVKNNLDVGSVKNQVKKQRDEILNEYVDYLKASGGQGVEQGGLIRDDTGTVIGRYGRTSRNPEWYRDFYRDYGRKPTNREYVEIAISHLTEGVPSEGIPANSEFISLDNTLKGLQGMEGKPLPTKFKQTLELPKLKDKTPIPKTPEGFNIDPNLGSRALNGGPLEPPVSSVMPDAKPLTKADIPHSIKDDDDVLLASMKWKDKSKPLLKRETMERNFEDIMGKEAPGMIEKYLDPIHKNESSRTRWLNQERAEIRSLGIKPRSKDSRLLQQFGEGKIDKASLKMQTNNWENVAKASDYIRGKYDSYLKQINEALARNGYDPIPKRKDYFLHFQELSERFETFGIPKSKKDWATFLKTDALPTDINGLTGMFKPGKNFFSSALQRKGDLTTFDAIQGIDKYLEGASKLIHQTDNIKRLRGLEKTLRDGIPGNHLSNFVAELGEYTNILAGKKAMRDRAAEDTMGRTIYTIINNLKKRTGANMVGANVSSALTNYIPLTQAAATTDKKSFVKGMVDTIANTFKNDGFVDSSDFLTRRIGSDPLSMKSWQKAANWMFDTVDGFTAQVVVRSKYLDGIKKGLTHSQAIKQADDWAVRMMADRTAGALPTLFNSQSLGVLTQFQTEVNNQLSFIFKDIPRKSASKKAAAAAIGQVFLYGYIFNNLYEKVVGRRPAFDPIGVAITAGKDFAEGNEKAGVNAVNNISDQLPFASTFTGGGRLPISAYLPNVVGMIRGEVKPTSLKEWAKPLALLPPTGGGQIKKTIEGALSLKKGGNYSSYLSPDAKLRFPVERTPANIGRSLLFGQYSTPEAREYFDKNRRMLSEDQTKAFQYAKEYGIDQETMYEILMEIRELEPLQNRKGVTDAQKTQVIAKSDLPQQHKALLNKLFVKTEIGKKIIEKKLK